MSFFRTPVSVAVARLAAVLLGLNACGGGSSSPAPTASYSLDAQC